MLADVPSHCHTSARKSAECRQQTAVVLIVRRYDVQAFRPTVFAGVPRVYDRFKDGVEAKIKEKGGLAAKLFVAGLEKKIAVLQVRILKPMQRKAQSWRFGSGFSAALVRAWLVNNVVGLCGEWQGRSASYCCIYDKVFEKVAAGIGLDRCRIFVTGGPEPVEPSRTTLLAQPSASPAQPSPAQPIAQRGSRALCMACAAQCALLPLCCERLHSADRVCGTADFRQSRSVQRCVAAHTHFARPEC